MITHCFKKNNSLRKHAFSPSLEIKKMSLFNGNSNFPSKTPIEKSASPHQYNYFIHISNRASKDHDNQLLLSNKSTNLHIHADPGILLYEYCIWKNIII